MGWAYKVFSMNLLCGVGDSGVKIQWYIRNFAWLQGVTSHHVTMLP